MERTAGRNAVATVARESINLARRAEESDSQFVRFSGTIHPMKVPNAEHAFIDLSKLREYALNPTHRVGGHKARLFASLLGLKINDAESLRAILQTVVQTHEAVLGELDEHGQRYVIDFLLTWQERQARVRSAWIVRADEDFPRLVTCYPL
jgi:hypothetical protein